MSQIINEIEGVSGSSKVKGHDPIDQKGLVEHLSYAMIVMEVLNKVGLSHQQEVMQVRGKLMDIETRMQNDFTTISEFISTVQNNAHSGAGEGICPDWCNHDGDGPIYSPNGDQGLSSDFYHASLTVTYSHEDEDMDPSSFKENIGDAYKTAVEGFQNAVKDLFYASSSTGSSGQLTVKDIMSIASPDGGKSFSMQKPYTEAQEYFQKCGLSMETSAGMQNVVSLNPTDHPSLLQQYMYYKAKVQVYEAGKSDLDAADGDITKIDGCDFNPDDQNCDPLLKTFIQMLNTLNVKVSVARNNSTSMMDQTTSDTLLHMLLDPKRLYSTASAGQWHHYHHHDSLAWKSHWYDYYTNQVHPGLYLAIGMAAFDYFWTKNPNASMDSNPTTPLNPGCAYIHDSNHTDDGNPPSDPLDNLYMTTNSVQTNLGQQSSQGNNNFQEDVNVSSQLDNMGVNSIKSFFEGNSTMNRNSRIS